MTRQAKPYAHTAGQRALQAYLQRRGISAEVCDGLDVSISLSRTLPHQEQPLVSIIIPTKDRLSCSSVALTP